MRTLSLVVMITTSSLAHAETDLYSTFTTGLAVSYDHGGLGQGFDGTFALGVAFDTIDLAAEAIARPLANSGDRVELGLGARLGYATHVRDGWLLAGGLSVRQMWSSFEARESELLEMNELAVDVSIGKRRAGWRGPLSGYLRLAVHDAPQLDGMDSAYGVAVSVGVRCDFTRR